MKSHAHEEGLQVSTLEETLKKLHGKTKLVVELKEKGYEEEVVGKIKEYFNYDEFVVISLYKEVIRIIKENSNDATTGLIMGYEYSELKAMNPRINHIGLLMERYRKLFPWKSLKKYKADFIAPHYELLHLGLLKSACNRNIPVFVWTVNNERRIKRLIKSKLLNGIISDKPDLVKMIKNDTIN